MGMMDYVRLSKSKGFSFDGRSQRAEFWWVQLYYSLISTAICFAAMASMVFSYTYCLIEYTENGAVFTTGLLMILWLLFIFGFSIWVFIRTLPVTIRRLHDVGIPGWVYLIVWLLGLSGIFILVVGCIDGEKGQNKYGWNPKERSGGSYNRPHGIDPSFYN